MKTQSTDKYHATLTNGIGADKQIAEKIEEEDKNSDYSDDDKQGGPNNKQQSTKQGTTLIGQAAKGGKKNYLQKTILDQTKELCYEHSSLYKDFDSMFMKILLRFNQWELFDDVEINLAC